MKNLMKNPNTSSVLDYQAEESRNTTEKCGKNGENSGKFV